MEELPITLLGAVCSSSAMAAGKCWRTLFGAGRTGDRFGAQVCHKDGAGLRYATGGTRVEAGLRFVLS
jgi:hypothetical protein